MFKSEHFIRHKPWLYHFTPAANLGSLQHEQAMLSAAAWVDRANEFEPDQIADPHTFLRAPRLAPVSLNVGEGKTVTLNDQLPLQHRTKFAGLRGSYEEFVRYLNGLVFFWPGNEVGPTPRGGLARTFEEHYAAFGVLRIPTVDAWIDGNSILFCRYNSGAPQARDGITRGPHIFVTNEDIFVRQIAEVVFRGQIELPPTTQWRASGKATWEELGRVG